MECALRVAFYLKYCNESIKQIATIIITVSVVKNHLYFCFSLASVFDGANLKIPSYLVAILVEKTQLKELAIIFG